MNKSFQSIYFVHKGERRVKSGGIAGRNERLFAESPRRVWLFVIDGGGISVAVPGQAPFVAAFQKTLIIGDPCTVTLAVRFFRRLAEESVELFLFPVPFLPETGFPVPVFFQGAGHDFTPEAVVLIHLLHRPLRRPAWESHGS